MSNIEIRNEAKAKGVMLWEIAERLGCTDSTFSRKLRRELTEEERKNISSIINSVAEEREAV